MEAKGIKETMELLSLLEEVGVALQKAKEDGKVNWMDLPKFAPVVAAGKNAIEGSHMVAAELKDLSSEEISSLINKMTAVISALVAGIMAK
jgi:hypothetical protein